MRIAKKLSLAVATIALLALAIASASASAAGAEAPEWRILSVAGPTNLPPSGEGFVVVKATNVGGVATDGTTVTVRDVLPQGLEANGISGLEINHQENVSCAASPALACTYSGKLVTGDTLEIKIPVTAKPEAASTVFNQASVSGGGAPAPASETSPLTISSARPAFGFAPGSVFTALSTHQAGAHPDITNVFTLTTTHYEPAGNEVFSAGNLKDVRFDLPPGLIGNTVGMPRCPPAKIVSAGAEACPRDTVVGIASVILGGIGGLPQRNAPIYNIPPAPGEPAAFEFKAVTVPVRLDTSVLSDGNYAVRVTAENLSEGLPAVSSEVTIWGVPADHQNATFTGPDPAATRVPLLTNPTQCSTPLTGQLSVDDWSEPGVFQSTPMSLGTPTGCGLLNFSGSLSMLPDTLQAGAPAGYALDLNVAQNNDPDGLAQPDVKKVVTTLPLGTVISPSAAWGLGSCSDEQFFGPAADRGLQQPANPGNCPRESQVGTVEIRTPALELPLQGEVYLGEPLCHPCTPEDAQSGRMVRLFVQVVGEGESGIVVKLEGTASINQQTGQITATFDNNPQLPFSELKLALGGGSRATLANPRTCGPAATNMQLTPWSDPFTTGISPLSTFEINQGCIGRQFNPSFTAGTTSIQAGEYTPFTLSFGRTDADEPLNGLQLQMPPGLLGSLAKVPLCREPQAAQGACGPESLIGHTQVLAGPGSTPFLVTGGQVFLTEGYKGAPFGLSIVVPAVAGPYTLSGTTGNGTVVVRAAINVDPRTAALTVTSDPLPTELDGIPLQLKVVNVTIDRPDFTLNPTSCNKMAVTGAISSTEGAGAVLSSPFQVTNCSGLAFKPKFVVSTSGRTSKANGANLDAKITFPGGATFANLAKVKVDLPKQLPSRLTTLQKACTAAVFNANPSNCPAASVVGIAKASTPILPVGLTGPVYFVSNGGEAFPNLDIVLQGYGVRVNVVGDTFISHAGITSTTFKSVPDVPISSFELYLPQGRYSALGTNGNLCKSKLAMPTAFTGQNGMEIHESTKVAVTNCPKAKKTKAKAKKKHRKPTHGKGSK
jgi:hypothetical protein